MATLEKWVSSVCPRIVASFVGAESRVPNSSGAIQLKSAIRAATREVVGSVGAPQPEQASWSNYVNAVVAQLRGVK